MNALKPAPGGSRRSSHGSASPVSAAGLSAGQPSASTTTAKASISDIPARPEHTSAFTAATTFSFLCPGRTIFFERALQNTLSQHGDGEHLLDLGIFPLQFLQPPSLVEVHLAELLLPTVERHPGDILLPADVHDARTRVRVPQYADILLCRVAFNFHGLWPFIGPD